jgi:NADH dehydrogenase [ubiquinone] 1 alpha subcomplex assembly factor 1
VARHYLVAKSWACAWSSKPAARWLCRGDCKRRGRVHGGILRSKLGDGSVDREMKDFLYSVVRSAALRSASVAACVWVFCFGSNAMRAGEPSLAQAQSITEFDRKNASDWQVVNDGVMGGLSEGKLTPNQGGTMLFSGMLSLENNGGFSTFRSGELKLDLSRHLGLLLRVKGDGRTYQVRLATDAMFRGMEVSFAAEIPTTKDEWIEVKVPFTAFKGSFRGLDLPKEKLDASKVRRIGILIGDKKQAPFAVELDFIRTYGVAGG